MKKTYGSVDLVVNNAGIQHIDEIVNLSFQNWRKVGGNNLKEEIILINIYNFDNNNNNNNNNNNHHKIRL